MQILDDDTAEYRAKNYPNRPFWLADLSMDRIYIQGLREGPLFLDNPVITRLLFLPR